MSEVADWRLFEAVALVLVAELGAAELAATGHQASIVRQLDGEDQRYWDIAVGDAGVLTLHLEHFVGITLYDAKPRQNDLDPSPLLVRAFAILSSFDPA